MREVPSMSDDSILTCRISITESEKNNEQLQITWWDDCFSPNEISSISV